MLGVENEVVKETDLSITAASAVVQYAYVFHSSITFKSVLDNFKRMYSWVGRSVDVWMGGWIHR